MKENYFKTFKYMSENIGKDILENPKDFLMITSKEQILEAYPDLFEKVNVGSIPFYLEKKPNKRILPGHRYVMTPSGFVRFEGKSDLVWKVSEESIDLLSKFNEYAAKEDRKWRNGERINDRLNLIEVDDFNLGTAFIPYGKEDVIKDAIHELEKAHAYDSVDKGNIE